MLNKKYIFILIASLFLAGFPMVAAAQVSGENFLFAQYVCKIRTCFLTNRLIYTVCGIAVSFLAVMVMFGRANFIMVLVTVIGIVVCTSAYKIVNSNILFPNAPATLGAVADGIQESDPKGGGNVIGTLGNANNLNIDPCIATSCYLNADTVMRVIN